MALTASERKTRALMRRLPPGEKREFLESMLPDRGKAVERVRLYAKRAERELTAWQLNWISSRIGNLLQEDMQALDDEIKAEEAERRRIKASLKVVKGERRR